MSERCMGHIIIETATTLEPVKCDIVGSNNNFAVGMGTLQDADVTNRNKRYYPKEDLFPQITCERTQELISTGNMRAENGHPLDDRIVRQQTIDPKNVCAIFLSMWTEDNYVKGTYRGTNNEAGREFDADLKDGFKPSWSLRALGNIHEEAGKGAVVRGVKLITYDGVIYPSHKVAYTERLVSESASMELNKGSNKLYLPKDDPGMIIPITNESVLDFIRQESANLKLTTESLEFDYDHMSVDSLFNEVTLKDFKTGDTLIVNLEDFIHQELMNESLKDII